MFCGLCGQHARHAKSPVPDLRRKPCPRFVLGSEIRGTAVVHRGCCSREVCSEKDGAGRVRCGWETGGRERLIASLTTGARVERAREAPGRA